MVKVDNKKAVKRLSKRSLKAARLRNIIAIIAIALTSILFTTLFTVGIGTVDAFEQASMRQVGTDAHGVVKYVADEDYERLKEHPLIKEISYNRILCERINNEELLKRHGEFWYMDDMALKHRFSEPDGGTRPVAENEIMADTMALQLLGVPLEVGAKVTLDLTVKGKNVTREFVLSGWYEPDPAINISEFIASKAYVERYEDELKSEYYETQNLTGAINVYLMFDNSRDLQGKLDRVLTESGFEISDETAPNYVDSNINWGYVSAGMEIDPRAILGILAAILVIIFTGYLIIYNIFQISVIRDIRFYGLLKTIGTTGKQIKTIIRRQAFILSAIGIPIGLIIGFLVGKGIVPLVVNQSTYAGSQITVSANPLIFIGAALFALLTVWISTRKPGRVAANVSPVEATRYSGIQAKDKKGQKKGTDGGKLYKMALSNVSRSKKRLILVLISLSLSLVLLNTVFTISRGFDMDKYLDKFVDTDFSFYHASLDSFEYYGSEESVHEEQIEAIQSQPGFLEGGRVYYSREEYFSVEDESERKEYNRAADGHPFAQVYGLDDFMLGRAEVLEGEFDLEKFKTGNYIIEGIHDDDYGNPYMENSSHEIGDKVTLHNHFLTAPDSETTESGTKEYELMAKVLISKTMYDGTWQGHNYYLPAEEYCSLITLDPIMSYNFDVEDAEEEAMEAFLRDYTEYQNPVMSYTSKQVAAKNFEGMQSLLITVGSLLALIIGLIGILNFANSMLTSIIARKKEFAVMQSIGMTRGQLKRMLCYEGLYYGIGTMLLSLVLGIAASLLIVDGIIGNLWFFTYRFVFTPLLICWIALIAIALLIPFITFKSSVDESIVERLREVE